MKNEKGEVFCYFCGDFQTQTENVVEFEKWTYCNKLCLANLILDGFDVDEIVLFIKVLMERAEINEIERY